MVNGSVFTTTNTTANPFPVFQTYTLGATSTVNYHAIATAQNIYNVGTPGYGVVNIIANSGTKSLIGTTFMQGTLTLTTNANTILDLAGNTLRLSGATPITVGALSTLTANGAGSTIALDGTASQTLTIAGILTANTITNLISNNTNVAGAILGATPAVYTVGSLTINLGATFSLGGRTLNLTGAYSNSGTLIGNAASSVLAFTGSDC
jgi:hypothetical protein